MKSIRLIVHNVRSCHNVGSLLRTADGAGVEACYFTGYTPHPEIADDTRLPHERQRITKQIQKTSLGAETTVAWQYHHNIADVIRDLRAESFAVFAVEQTPDAISLPAFEPPQKIALIVGNEVEGVDAATLQLVDGVLEIPMFGKKESFNVVQAAGMALYHCRFC